MSRLHPSIPRAPDFEEFAAEPLHFLAENRARLGDIFVVRENAPVFSRSADCTGVVAAFGAQHQRAVLSDIEAFGMPVSAARQLGLPANLINLNRSLQSMRGDQHTDQKRALMGMISEFNVDAQHESVCAALEGFVSGWQVGSTIGLLAQMRELTLQASARVLFGDRYAFHSRLARLLQTYFELRREASSQANPTREVSREQLVAAGNELDDALRIHVRECRQSRVETGLFGKLAILELCPGQPLTEDEVVGHANVLVVSSIEPIAVALTWTLLILSQLPLLRSELRHEFGEIGSTRVPTPVELARMPLLDGVIKETLRLLPPNAFMVRVTTDPTSLNGVDLPKDCEVILCPFLAHRDSGRFANPHEFLPARWLRVRPGPFEYLPFGAGGHSCVGRNLATYLIKTVIAFLLPRYDLVLAGDQHVDWRTHILFMPRSDPMVNVQLAGASVSRMAGRLGGPIGKLLFTNSVPPSLSS